MKRSPKMIKLLSNNKLTSRGFRQLMDNPKTVLYAFPAVWVCCFVLTFYVFYTQLLAYLLESHPILNMLLGFLLVTHVTLYVYVGRSDPGYVGREMTVDFDGLVENLEENGKVNKINPQQICYTCDIVKPLRSKHCRICDRCVYRFDHHCGWTGNCVGQKNHPYFVAFIVIQELVHIVAIFLTISALIHVWSDELGFFQNHFANKALTMVMLINMAGLIMTGGLMKQHVEMMLNNETTNEVMNWARYPHFWRPVTNGKDGRRGLAYTNPFHQGYKNNCEQFCFGLPSEKDLGVYAKLDSVHIVNK